MRTFIAFKFDEKVGENTIREGIKRVRKHYYETYPINFEVEEFVYIYKNIGAVIFDSSDTPLKWKSIVEKNNNALITNFPPPNWEVFSKTGDIEEAPKEMLDLLLEDKDIYSQFSTPTCLCTINKEKGELDIFTDPFGFARLYEYRGENGWFWSNRPGALTLMANEKAELSQDAWEFMCYAGWFADTSSPIEKVIRIEPGIRINVSINSYSPRLKIDNGAFDKIVSPRKYKKFNAHQIAEDMLSNLSSFSKLWSLPLDVDLSGGKDSRLCAAAVIASKTEEVQFNTIANLEQEGIIAKRLLEEVDLTHKHNITRTNINTETGIVTKTDIKTRMKFLHHLSDGDLTPIQTRKDLQPNSFFNEVSTLKVQGAAGEIGKATYYGSDSFYNKLIKKGNHAAFERLSQTYSNLAGIKSDVRERANRFIFSIIQDGKNKGISDLYLLDYFYLMERARRWLPQSIDNRRYSAFFSNEFLAQSFNMSYEEKRNLDIYTSIINNLVPEWDQIPFYKKKPSDRDERTEKGQRIWQTSDKKDIEEILNNPNKWNDIFEENEVIEIWNAAIEGTFNPNIESLFDRLIMKATYQDHLDILNSQIETKKNLEEKELIFNPSKELNLQAAVRLIIYDDNSLERVIDEVIFAEETFKIKKSDFGENSRLKFKYQYRKSRRWEDVKKYKRINF